MLDMALVACRSGLTPVWLVVHDIVTRCICWTLRLGLEPTQGLLRERLTHQPVKRCEHADTLPDAALKGMCVLLYESRLLWHAGMWT